MYIYIYIYIYICVIYTCVYIYRYVTLVYHLDLSLISHNYISIETLVCRFDFGRTQGPRVFPETSRTSRLVLRPRAGQETSIAGWMGYRCLYIYIYSTYIHIYRERETTVYTILICYIDYNIPIAG